MEHDVLMRFGLVLVVNNRVGAGKKEKLMVYDGQLLPEYRNLTKCPLDSME